MRRHYQVPARLWPALLEGFAREPGCCLFDVPGPTHRPAETRILTALPGFREHHPAAGEGLPVLTPRALRPPGEQAESRRDWLPIKLGYLHYGNGEPAPALTVAEYDWALVRCETTDSVSLLFHRDCPRSRRDHVLKRLEQAEHGDAVGVQADPFRIVSPFRACQSREEYLERIERIQAYINAGDVYQVNYAQQFEARFRGHPARAFRALHAASPSPCSVYLDTGESRILSLSPERFLSVVGGVVETRPIKGTRPRGSTPAEDERLSDELRHSRKDRAENLMIVDLLRNDLGKCCEIGSIRAEPLFALETFANVHHLVSTVTGRLAPGLSPIDLLLSAFPGGSVTGAPKVRAMQIIRELEPVPRGAYCGSFFHWTPRNGFDSTIAIRTLECRGERIECKAGGGIVADSEPQAEYRESVNKVRLFMDVLEGLG